MMTASTRTAAVLAIGVTLLGGVTVPAWSAGKRARERGPRTYSGIVPWSQFAGKPKIRPGHEVGYFIWHVGNEVHIKTTSESKQGLIFAGIVNVTGGTITNAHAGKLERREDGFQQTAPNVLQFRFDTHRGTDEVVFDLTGGTQLAFDFRLQGQPTNRNFFGPRQVEVLNSPIVCDLSR